MEHCALGQSSWQHRMISWFSVLGVLTFMGAVFFMISAIPGFRDYYFFEWLMYPRGIIGFLIATGIATLFLLIPPGLPWWRIAISGSGAGAASSVLGGLFYFFTREMNLTSWNLLYLALCGAVPGLVISIIHSTCMASRRRHFVHYIGAALLEGSIITLLGTILLLLFGTWRLSLSLPLVIGCQFWLVPTIFSIAVMTALYVAELVNLHLTTPNGEPTAPAR